MNNLEFDHGDIFRDLQDISRSFSHLLRIVPSDGFVLRNGDDSNLLDLPDATWTRIISVGVGEDNEFRITDFTEDADGSRFGLSWKGEPVMQVDWNMPGLFNARNLAMATLASVLSQQICQADDPFDITSQIHSSMYPCPTFRNVRGSREDRRFYTTVSNSWYSPTLPIIPLLLPVPLNPCVPAGRAARLSPVSNQRSNTAVTNVFEDRFADALAIADIGLLGAVHRAEKNP